MSETKTLYLCGGINGLTDSQCLGWRNWVKQELAGLYHFLDPMRRDFRGREDECAGEIVRGDIADIDASNVVLVNAERPSWGTAMECIYAFCHYRTVVVVCPSERVSPWLRCHSHYLEKSLADAIELLRRTA